MCGIVGVAARTPIRSRGWLAAGRDAMAHRGPTDSGEYWSDDGRVGFGHRRLSIIDLSAAGHQPMQTPDGQLCITFNGEIYNYTELKRELEILRPRLPLILGYGSHPCGLPAMGQGLPVPAAWDVRVCRLRQAGRHRLPGARQSRRKAPLLSLCERGITVCLRTQSPSGRPRASAAGQSRSARLLSGRGLHFR